MKRLSLVVSILFLSCSSISKYKKSEESKFKLPYEFLLKEYGENTEVSDSIVNIDLFHFAHEISKNKKINMLKVSDSLEQLSSGNKYKKYFYPANQILKTSKEESNYKVFFSKPINDFIMAEVFRKENDKANTYDELTFFGSSDVFLFIFKNNVIDETYKIKLDYN